MRILFCVFLMGLPSLMSCKNGSDHRYAIKDFRSSLQPELERIVTRGIVMPHNDVLHEAGDKEILRLRYSEHPLLRSAAFGEIMEREHLDRTKLLMEHLTDTAIVNMDAGEFGVWMETVSDCILLDARSNMVDINHEMLGEILTRHNYLKTAYRILDSLKPQEKYYPYIKEMAIRPRHFFDGYESGFSDVEYALYGLAKFKKPADIPIIRDRMMKDVYRLSFRSFWLMTAFPDTAYFPVLEKYHRRQFYEFSGNRPGGFTGFAEDRASPEDFIEALVMQQSEESARILDEMLTWRIAELRCFPDKENIIDALMREIWDHPCAAYAKLRERIKPVMDKKY